MRSIATHYPELDRLLQTGPAIYPRSLSGLTV